VRKRDVSFGPRTPAVGDHAKAKFFEHLPGGPAADDRVKNRLATSRFEGQGIEGLRCRSFSAL
jgi:hypothetical protein